MKKSLVFLIAILFAGAGILAQTTNSPVVTNLSAQRFKIIIANDKTANIIDLRTTDEMNNGYIKGAVQVDFLAKDAEKKIDALDKNKTYYIYCQSGGRSADAAEYMEKHNFKRVYTLEKGFSDWSSKGYPVERK